MTDLERIEKAAFELGDRFHITVPMNLVADEGSTRERLRKRTKAMAAFLSGLADSTYRLSDETTTDDRED